MLKRLNAFMREYEPLGVLIVVVALGFTVYFQYEQLEIWKAESDARAEERLARMWSLATDPRPGNSGKIPALEYLNKLKQPLSGIAIPKAYLENLNLPKANLNKANLSGAYLFNANLNKAHFAAADLSEADLSDADLSSALLNWTDLHGADLRKADLRRADLRRANLSGANLSGANLNRADLRRVDLSGADLSGADVTRANLGEVKNLTQAMLDKACIEEGQPLFDLPAGLIRPTKICAEKKR